MIDLIKNLVDKISSYNIFNNLYPGIIFCYSLKYMLNTNILLDNWLENLVIFYFLGMVMSRIGSLIIEPILKKIKIKNKSDGKSPILKFASYTDYERASKSDTLISTFSEVNNTYRTMLACFFCVLIYKLYKIVNGVFISFNFYFFEKNGDWFIIIGLIMLFLFSYIKQTKYIRIRIESLLKKVGPRV